MVRLPILRTASTTMAITTGCIPYRRPVIAGTSAWATAKYESSQSTKIEGITKNEPATIPHRPVQPPPDIRSDLLGLGTGQEHAEVERSQVLLLGDPALLLHQLFVHDGDLASRATEVYEPELHPKPERLPEPDRLDLRSLLCHLRLHFISIR